MAGTTQTGTELTQSGAAGGGLANATALAGNARAWLTAMHPARRRQLGAAVLFTAAVVSALVWYANRPDWRMLYSGLESKDLQQVAQELTAANIPYQMTDDSSGIEVSSDQLDRARMEVATKGIVRPEDISQQNQVLSTAISSMELEVRGKGIVNDYTHRPNPVVRLLQQLLIF